MNFLPASGGWYNCLFWCLNVICDLNEAGHCKNCCVGGCWYWWQLCSIWSCILSLNRYSINRYYPFIYSICFAHRGCPKLQELVVGAGCGPCVRPWHLTLTGQCPLVPGWWSAGPAGALTQGTRSCRPGNVTTACKECPMDISIAVLLTNIVFTILLYSSWLSSCGSYKWCHNVSFPSREIPTLYWMMLQT